LGHCCCGRSSSSGVTKSQSVRVSNINKSRDWWMRVHIEKVRQNTRNSCIKHKYIVYILLCLNKQKTGSNRSRTGPWKFHEAQDRGPDFLRTGKTGTAVLVRTGYGSVRSQSFFGPSDWTLKHYLHLNPGWKQGRRSKNMRKWNKRFLKEHDI
jgi:hypothetical protein